MADTEKETGQAKEEEVLEETVKEAEVPKEDIPEEASGEETEAEEEAGEDTEEDGEEESEEPSDEAGEQPEEPQKKERKLNWTKMGKGAAKETKEDILSAELAEEKDKYARLIAEFDNFRKRNEKEKDQMYDFGAKVVVEKILPVIDNFERGLNALTDEEKEGAFAKGMDKTYKQFMDILDSIGVKPIEAVGEQFDPEIHNAVMHVDDEQAGENIVVEEFQKGYMYKDKLVRPSMVKVAN